MVDPALCIECGQRHKQRPKHRCSVCIIRHLGVTERVAESRRRAAMVPVALRVKTVPARLWPPGQRWCAGCQSFVDLEDCGKSASQCRACMSAKNHAAMVVKTYGLEQTEYERLLEFQDGRCAICGARPGKRRLAVDHRHSDGVVRGLLCAGKNNSGCNFAIGLLHDDVDIVGNAHRYLQRPPLEVLQSSDHAESWKAHLSTAKPEVATSPSKPSRFVDAPDPYAKPTATGAPNVAPTALGSGMTVAELTLIGGSQDENGYYRLYQHRDDPRFPF